MNKINNTAFVSFSFAGSQEKYANISNTDSVCIKTEKSICIKRTSSSAIFVPGNQITFTLDITNTGSLWFSGVRVVENLSGIGYLTYVPGSAKLLYYGQWLEPQIVDVNPLTFTLSPLSVGQTMTLQYTCAVNSNIPEDIMNLVSTVSATGYTYNSVAIDTNLINLSRSNAAYLSIKKDSSAQNVVTGQTFDYIITLENFSTNQIDVSNFVDKLPAGFKVSQVSIKIDGGMTTILAPTDYNIDSNNVLTIPSATGMAINVPAISAGLAGTTIIIVRGSF